MARRPARNPRRSPAACLLPQIAEARAASRRFRPRRLDGDARQGSPGKFFTYFSAGALLLSEDERRRRRVVARSPRLAIGLAVAFAAVWFLFR